MLKSIFSIESYVIKMLLLVVKKDFCSNFVLYLDKIKIRNEESIERTFNK